MDPLDIEMSTSASLALAFLFSATLTGIYFYDMNSKFRKLEKKVNDIEYVSQETSAIQEAHTDTLQEHNERIREKKDYDETEEVEDGKYQAWSGFILDSNLNLTVRIWREKESTVKKNQDWTNWDRTVDGSCIVRDFYLGNGNPDFSWILRSASETSDTVSAEMRDTLINGWDSVCKIEILLLGKKDYILTFVEKQTFEGSETCNLILKKAVAKEQIQWSRVLIEPK